LRTSGRKKILVVPNEDGAGPSALVSHVVRHMLKIAGAGIEVTVWNRSRLGFNRTLYQDLPGVRMEPVWNLIELAKDPETGEVSMPGTFEILKDYETLRESYPGGAVSGEADFRAVIEFGVPAAVRWAEKKGIPCISVFDHAWSRTLEMIMEQGGRARGEDRCWLERHAEDWGRLVRAVQEDEARVQRLFVFPPFMTPPVFRSFWEGIRVRAQETGAVFGGKPARNREQALAFLDLMEPGRTVLALGGDTPVWDSVLVKMAQDLVEKKAVLDRCRINVVIYVPYRLLEHEAVQRLDEARPARVRRLDHIPGGTLQEILPAVDLVVSRAGGGVVNDAVACRVPLVCMPEGTQPQVQAILEACLAQGMARKSDPTAFALDPVGTVLGEAERIRENRSLSEQMRGIPVGGEAGVARAVLEATQQNRR
jgi:hypothetical protein